MMAGHREAKVKEEQLWSWRLLAPERDLFFEEEVIWLEVAMYEALRVGERERLTDRSERARDLPTAPVEPSIEMLAERPSTEPIHDPPGTIGAVTDLSDCEERGVGDRLQAPSQEEKVTVDSEISQKAVSESFHRKDTAARVLRLIYATERALSGELEERIVSELKRELFAPALVHLVIW